MFIWTAKVNRRKVALTLVGAAAVCGAILYVILLGGRGAAASGGPDPKGVKTAQDRSAYLAGWGWLTPADAESAEELALPEEFGSEYSQYLELQAGQGFDLTKYAGKRIKRYTYNVLNYPGGVQGAQAHLLLYKNTVIGGEIVGENFLHGLQMPDQAPAKG